MGFTDEQRRKAAETRQRNRAAKAERQTTLATAEPEPDAEGDVLTQLIATLQKAQDKKGNQAKLLGQLAELLDQIDPQKNPELAEDPTIQAFVDKINEGRVARAQASGAAPGTQIGSGLGQDGVPWRYTDLDKYCTRCNCPPEKRPAGRPDCGIWPCPTGTPDLVIGFIPPVTERVVWNGLECQFNANEEMPPIHRVFVDVYRETLRARRIAAQHAAFLFGESDVCPPELLRGDQAVGTMKARAFMSAGKKGGGSIIVGWGGDEKFGARDFGAGEQPVVPSETANT